MLIAWEAQFGDFVNGKVIIDQFIASAEKGEHPAASPVLPRRGHGPGALSRLERFLGCVPTTTRWSAVPPASRSSIYPPADEPPFRKPLVVMMPKSMLRLPPTRAKWSSSAPGVPERSTTPATRSGRRPPRSSVIPPGRSTTSPPAATRPSGRRARPGQLSVPRGGSEGHRLVSERGPDHGPEERKPRSVLPRRADDARPSNRDRRHRPRLEPRPRAAPRRCTSRSSVNWCSPRSTAPARDRSRRRPPPRPRVARSPEEDRLLRRPAHHRPPRRSLPPRPPHHQEAPAT